jgi:chromate reductase
MTTPLRILGVSGSLRANSFNRALLHAAIELAPQDMMIEEYVGIGDLPLYNPDIDTDGGPPHAAAWRAAVRAADGLLLATPEYNYGPTGALKNAIDWASRPPSDSSLRAKPIAMIGAATGMSGTARAQLALRQSFVFTQSYVLPGPEVLMRDAAARFDADLRLTDATTRDFIARLLVRFADFSRRLSHA